MANVRPSMKDAVISSKAHVPTGRVSFENVVAFLIREFAVPASRTDWQGLLRNNDQQFRDCMRAGFGG